MKRSGIIPINRRRPTRRAANLLCRCLTSGGCAVLPTETDYALAADASNEAAVDRVRALKGRDSAKPFSVFVPDIETAVAWGFQISPESRNAAETYWPGPLTLILPCERPILPWLGAHGQIGVRVSPEPILKLILLRLGKPLVATSANPSGAVLKAPVQDKWIRQQAKNGNLIWARARRFRRNRASTVARISNENIEILRDGPISQDQIRAAIVLK